MAMLEDVELSDSAIAARVRRSNGRVLAAYMAMQAVAGMVFWIALVTSTSVRDLFDLMPSSHPVTDAFFLADLLVGVAGSGLSAGALWSGARWSVPIVAFTTGGIVYPTLYLVCWVAMTGTGGACLAIMIPPSLLSSYVAWHTWRTHTALVDSSSQASTATTRAKR